MVEKKEFRDIAMD